MPTRWTLVAKLAGLAALAGCAALARPPKAMMRGLDHRRRRTQPGARPVLALCLAFAVALGGTACGGGGGSAPEASAQPAQRVPLPPLPPPTAADVTLLMMGNSHTEFNDLPQQLRALLSAGLGGRSVAVTVAPGWMFLDERWGDPASLALLRSQPWTVVVLQAQKYSTTGVFEYSTAGAEALIRASRAAGALPMMFPEWPRLGVPETARIYDLHATIARSEPACVAPIGQAWDLALQRFPALTLHAGDGNHSAPAGAFLAALMLYATLSDGPIQTLPDLQNGVDPSVQAQLRQVAADTLRSAPPRQHCPLDKPLSPKPGSE